MENATSVEKRIADLSVTVADSVTGGIASHVVEGATFHKLGARATDMSMVRVQSAAMAACEAASDVLYGAINAAKADPSARVEHQVLDGMERLGREIGRGNAASSRTFNAADAVLEVEKETRDIAKRTVKEAIQGIRATANDNRDLAKFFEGATGVAFGPDRPARDAAARRYLSLAGKLAAVGVVAAMDLAVSSQQAAAGRVFIVRQAPVARVQPAFRPAFQQAPVAQGFARRQNNAVVVERPLYGRRIGTGYGNGYGTGVGIGAAVGVGVGLGVAAAVASPYPRAAYPSYGYQPNANGYGAYVSPQRQGFAGHFNPTRDLLLAAKAVTAARIGSVEGADEMVDHAVAAASRCMEISMGSRPCSVRFEGIEFDYASSNYRVSANGVVIAAQVGDRVEVNREGMAEALRQAKDVQLSEREVGHGNSPRF